MPKPPIIIVQLIHIQGPLKGEIQEFSDPEILIGRHPSCHVQFPKDLATISRHHAKIVRDGNRFKLIDQSVNGTFIKGKRVSETYLNPGDVIIFAEESGPKVSFLSEMRSGAAAAPPPHRPPVEPPRKPEPPPPSHHEPTFEMEDDGFSERDAPFIDSAASPPPIEKVKVPLAIQYGPILKGYRELPIVVGRHPDCDFSLDHPDVLDRHLQVFFSGDRYGVKDLTGKQMVLVNGRPCGNYTLLNPSDQLKLGPKGPSFQFLAGGRLAEIEAPAPGTSSPEEDDDDPALQHRAPDRSAEDQSSKGRNPKGRNPKGRKMIDKLFNR